jgi:hypothetical protein
MTGTIHTTAGMAQQFKTGQLVFPKVNYKLIAAAMIAVALYVPFHILNSAPPGVQAALQKSLKNTAESSRVQINYINGNYSQHGPSTPNSSMAHHHHHAPDTNTSATGGQSSRSPRPSPSPLPQPKPKSCHHLAILDQPTAHEMTVMLGHQVRPLPSTDSSSPVLSTSNWEGPASEEHAGDTQWECHTRVVHTAPESR